MRRILVALDETDASARAAEFVNGFFASADVEVLAVNVAPVPIPWYPRFGTSYGMVAPYAFPAPRRPIDEWQQRARTEARDTIAESGVDEDRADVAFGDPVEAIRAAAAEHDAELVVVGSSDKGWWKRLLEGSVSAQLARKADRPVLVVH